MGLHLIAQQFYNIVSDKHANSFYISILPNKTKRKKIRL